MLPCTLIDSFAVVRSLRAFRHLMHLFQFDFKEALLVRLVTVPVSGKHVAEYSADLFTQKPILALYLGFSKNANSVGGTCIKFLC